MAPTAGEPRRRALPLSFRRTPTSEPSSPSSLSQTSAASLDEQRDLAVAADHSFIETTSEAAANALARFYGEQAGEGGYGVLRVERDGKTVYRIRPVAALPPTSPTASSSSSAASSGRLPFARPSHQPPAPAAGPSARPVIALHRSSVRHSQSIPNFRSDADATILPSTAAGLLSPISAEFPPAAHDAEPSTSTLRKVGSSPSLRAVPRFESGFASAPNLERRTPRSSGAAEGDVLGRILGWRSEIEGRGAMGEGRRSKNRSREQSRSGMAQVGLPDMFRRDGTGEVRKKGSAVSQAESDRSDLPQDPVVETLEAVEAPELPFAAAAGRRPSVARAVTSPFGEGVRIPRLRTTSTAKADTGSRPHSDPQPPPLPLHTMREVSSDDSIRTAKADDPAPAFPPSLSLAPETPKRRFEDPSIFDCFHRLDLATSPASSPRPSESPVTAAFGQHGRLPSSASLSSVRSDASGTSAHNITISPAPGDDPRFVIWGYRDPPPARPGSPPVPTRRTSVASGTGSIPVTPARFDPSDIRRQSIAEEQYHDSPTSSATGSPSNHSRRWSVSQRGSGGVSSPATSVRDSVGSAAKEAAAQRILMAATVERLVAELTSEISAELLDDFFLTYRHYLAPLDLLHLLITRFEWAMTPPSPSLALSVAAASKDDATRRIVRVRTFVVLRFWLMNHFVEDFYPNRDLRMTFTSYLNNASRDERFKASPKDMRLIKQLKKTVRKCKEMYVLGGVAAFAPASTPAATATTTGKSPLLGSGEEDVDLDEDAGSTPAGFGAATTANATASLASPPPVSSSFGFGSLRGRNKLFPSAFASSSSSPSSASPQSTLGPPAPLPEMSAQNPIARSFTTAMGTFGRFKRKIAQGHLQRSGSTPGEDGGLELVGDEGSDLLWVKGGLERYLQYWNIQEEPEDVEGELERTPVLEPDSAGATPESDNSDDARTPQPDLVVEPTVAAAEPTAEEGVGLGLGIVSTTSDAVSFQPVASSDYAFPAKAAVAAEPPSQPAFPPPAAAPGPTYTFTLDPLSSAQHRPHSTRIELDDLDDSDDDDDVVEVKRTLKRLPGAANLRLAATGAVPPHHLQRSPYRRSMDSEMSYGFGALGAPWSASDGPPRDSVLFVDDEDGVDVAGMATVPGFVLDGLLESDDEEEPGDVEAALRRLEGFVDASKERDKARRVERQMQKSSRMEERKGRRQARIDAGETVESDEEDDDEIGTPSSRKPSVVNPETAEPVVLLEPPTSETPRDAAVVAPVSTVVDPAPPSVAQPPVSPQAPTPAIGYSSSRPPPLTRIQTRRNTGSPTSPPILPPSFRKPSLSRIFGVSSRPASARPSPSAGLPAPPTHRSFLLFCRTDLLSQQFALIERDLLRVLSYQELVSGSWRDRIAACETDVLDWEQYLKERRRSDVLAKEKGEQPRSAVQDVISRFNLTANWTASEILLTASLDERAFLLSKFIRLAWKCYCQSNFQTLTQIIHGLQIPHVERLKKTWAKVPAWEMRKFHGMQNLVSHLSNFKLLRNATNDVVAALGSPGQAASIDARVAGSGQGCIPFFGLFLRDLALNSELPTFLDPSSPHDPASVTSSGSLLCLADPSSLASLSPLPGNIPLAPLVNVHKFRVLASTVHRVIEFQHLAGQYAFEPEVKTFMRCLKIRALSQSVMHELSIKLEA
ncbi:hypothetical protein JCM10207_001635 [Rhodosporidiobolus poonsookiae]